MAEAAGFLPVRADLRDTWERTVSEVFAEALLEQPKAAYAQRGGREGIHNEALGHLLAEMQVVHRAHPGARW